MDKNGVTKIGEPVLYYTQYCTRCHISWVGKEIREDCVKCKKQDAVVGVDRLEMT